MGGKHEIKKQARVRVWGRAGGSGAEAPKKERLPADGMKQTGDAPLGAETELPPLGEPEPAVKRSPEPAPAAREEPRKEVRAGKEKAPKKEPVKKEKPPKEKKAPRKERAAAKKASAEGVAEEPGAKKKKRVGLKLGLGAAALVLVLLAGVLLFINGKLNKLNYNETVTVDESARISSTDDETNKNLKKLEQREGASALPTDDVFKDKDVVNLLLLGTDMKIPGTKDPGRCDATMVCSLNKKTGEIKLVSFERAIGVPVPGYEDEQLAYVFQYGGGDFMQETITKCFRVDLTGYVHVGYEVFPEVIDALGGIDVELDSSEVYYMSEYLKYDKTAPKLKVGMNHLNGTAAYSYCRLRDPDDDWSRQGRTRQAVQALVDKLKTASAKELNSMLDTVLPMVGTNLSKGQISSLMLSAPKFINASVGQLMIPAKDEAWSYVTGRGAYMVGCDYAAGAKLIREFLYGA